MNIAPNALLARSRYAAGMPSDPVSTAAEAACNAVARTCDYQEPWMAAVAAADAMPVNTTDFERGLAAGIAFGLIAAPRP